MSEPEGQRRWAKFVRRGAVALVVGVVLLELSLRWLIFSDSDLARKLSETLREPSKYCAHECGTEFYLVRAAMAKRALVEYDCPTADPLLGWRSDLIAPVTYAHAVEPELAGRRPVLFYGDSFTQCVERAGTCWESLFADSELAESAAVLNYGVGGFGFDQTFLTCRETLPRFADQEPIVLVGLLIDDDLDRCALSLRSWPKPRYQVDGDELVLQLPAGACAADVLEHESAGITSYVVRFLLHNWKLVSPQLRRSLLRREGAEENVRAVVRGILDEFQGLFAAQGIDPLFVVFHGPELSREGAAVAWREEFFVNELTARGFNFLHAGSLLRAEAARRTESTDEYFFLDDGLGRNHLNARGNDVVFGALRGEIARLLEAGFQYDGDTDGR